MADSDKNILITPNRGATSQPSVVFTGQGNDPITVRVLDGTTGTGLTAGGALSFEGSAGQLFSVVNRLGTGSIFSVNDISGIPSIDVDANGTIEFAPFTGYVAIGLTFPTEKLHVSGNILGSGRISAVGGLSASGGLGVTGGATFNGNVRVNAANTLFAEYIQTATTQLNIDNRASGRVAIGDQALNGNGTYIFLRDAASTFEISNPSGDIAIGDPLGVNTGNFISYQASTGLLTGNNVNNISGFNNITTGRLNVSNGISAAGGGTFSSVVRFLSGLSASGGTFSGTQTFVNGATFSAIANFVGGLCASGGTFGNLGVTGDVRFHGALIGSTLGTAPKFFARAWVSYSDTASAINGSGNVSSVTEVSTGVFTLNFATAMPDTNYAVTAAARQGAGAIIPSVQQGTFGTIVTTTSVQIRTTNFSDTLVVGGDFLGISVFR